MAILYLVEFKRDILYLFVCSLKVIGANIMQYYVLGANDGYPLSSGRFEWVRFCLDRAIRCQLEMKVDTYCPMQVMG